MSHHNYNKNPRMAFNPTPKWNSLCTVCGKLVEQGQAYHVVKTRRGFIWAHIDCLREEAKA